MMKGEIVLVEMLEDEFYNKIYRVIILFDEKPKLMLGDVEINQK